MLVDLSLDRHYAFPGVHETAGSALVETAAALVRTPSLAGDLRRIQKAINQNASVANVYRALLESNRPDDREYVRQHGLRALKIPQQRTVIHRRGEAPIVLETRPAKKVRPSKMTDDQLLGYLHTGSC